MSLQLSFLKLVFSMLEKEDKLGHRYIDLHRRALLMKNRTLHWKACRKHWFDGELDACVQYSAGRDKITPKTPNKRNKTKLTKKTKQQFKQQTNSLPRGEEGSGVRALIM